MTIKEAIIAFIKQNEATTAFLRNDGQDYEHVDKKFPHFTRTLQHTNFTTPLGLNFTRFLLLSNKEEHRQQYELKDIRDLFESLLKVEAASLDIFIEAAYFEWAIMNNNNYAMGIIQEGIKKARRRIEEMENIVAEINKEDERV